MKKFWNWYDGVREPYRFLFALFVLALPLHISAITNQYLFMSLFLPVVISRWLYMVKK
jgi:hypothetical protein